MSFPAAQPETVDRAHRPDGWAWPAATPRTPEQRNNLTLMAEATRRLLLLRHAKSSWDDPSLADHDRPLAPRGRRAAKRIGEYLRDEQVEIALVLCSSAARAQETLERVRPPGEVRIEPSLYGAGAHQLLERVRRVPDEAGSVMLIGHNPAMEDLAVLLTDAAALTGEKFPTGALATLTFTGSWRQLGPGTAELESFVRPRELD
jgi:phosphohistidine phosphatase